MKKYWLVAFAALALLLPASGSVLADLPYLPIYDPLAGQPRDVHMYNSGEMVQPGTASTIIASARGLWDPQGRLLSGEQMRLTVEGGDGVVDSLSDGVYSIAGASNSISMDHICYVAAGGTEIKEWLLATADHSNFARVEIASFGTPCPKGYIDSGWYMAKFYAPTSIQRDQLAQLRVTDISVEEQPSDTVNFFVSLTVGAPDIQLMDSVESNDTTMRGDIMSSIVFVKNARGFGIGCGPSASMNGETPSASGCTDARNGYSVSAENSLSLNQANATSPSISALYYDYDQYRDRYYVNPHNFLPLSRGAGTVDVGEHRILTNLGGGAYISFEKTTLAAGATSDRLTGVIHGTSPSGGAIRFFQTNVFPLHFYF